MRNLFIPIVRDLNLRCRSYHKEYGIVKWQANGTATFYNPLLGDATLIGESTPEGYLVKVFRDTGDLVISYLDKGKGFQVNFMSPFFRKWAREDQMRNNLYH